MVAFLQSPTTYYAFGTLVLIIGFLAHRQLHKAVTALQAFINLHLPRPIAMEADAFLEAVEKLLSTQPSEQSISDMFSVMDQLTLAAVQSANNTQVKDAKANNLFTDAVAASVKSSVVQQVLTNLGPLQNVLAGKLGNVQPIIEQLVEKHVAMTKGA